MKGKAVSASITLLSVASGAFFALSGFNKLTNKGRHAALVATLQADHVPAVGFNQWWVPSWEFLAGTSLAVGLYPKLAAAVLAIIMLVALVSEARKRVAEWQPINVADRVDDYLYLQESCYLIMLAAIIIA